MKLIAGTTYKTAGGALYKVILVHTNNQAIIEPIYGDKCRESLIIYDDAELGRFSRNAISPLDLVAEYFPPVEFWTLMDHGYAMANYTAQAGALLAVHDGKGQRIVHMKEVVS